MSHRPTAALDGPRLLLERITRSSVERGPGGPADFFASDGVLEFPFAPVPPFRLEGRDAISRHMATVENAAVLDIKAHTIVSMHETPDPEVVIAELELSGTVKGTDKPFRLCSIAILRVRDGELVFFRDYNSPLAAAAAARRLPELFTMLTSV